MIRLLFLFLCCLVSCYLSFCRVAYDVYYLRAYRVAMFEPLQGPDADLERADRIVGHIRQAEKYGIWRPETAFFAAREYERFNMHHAARPYLDELRQTVPYAWWARALIDTTEGK